MRIGVVIYLIVILVSCKTSENGKGILSDNDTCKELVVFLKDSWKKNKNGYFYFDKKSNYNSTHMDKCLKGKTKKEIRKIFGTPSAEVKDRYYYYMSAECGKDRPAKLNYRCLRLLIYFDKNGLVSGIPAIMREPPVNY